MTNEELAELQSRISNLEAQLAILREQLAAEYARRAAIVRVRQTVTYDAVPTSGGVTLSGGAAQSVQVPIDADVATWQAAVAIFGEDLHTVTLDNGAIVIERDEVTPPLSIARVADLVAAESCSVEISQPGIAQGPDSDPPGQSEVISQSWL